MGSQPIGQSGIALPYNTVDSERRPLINNEQRVTICTKEKAYEYTVSIGLFSIGGALLGAIFGTGVAFASTLITYDDEFDPDIGSGSGLAPDYFLTNLQVGSVSGSALGGIAGTICGYAFANWFNKHRHQ